MNSQTPRRASVYTFSRRWESRSESRTNIESKMRRKSSRGCRKKYAGCERHQTSFEGSKTMTGKRNLHREKSTTFLVKECIFENLEPLRLAHHVGTHDVGVVPPFLTSADWLFGAVFSKYGRGVPSRRPGKAITSLREKFGIEKLKK